MSEQPPGDGSCELAIAAQPPAGNAPSTPLTPGFETDQAPDYYDSESDAHARQTYWEGLSPASADLAQRVNQVLEGAHNPYLSYEPSKYLYPWVDLRPNSKVRSIYSGFEAAPEVFIARDREADRQRALARTALLQQGPLASAGLEARLEADFLYNCEHVVPQSWFEKRAPMRGDLHHLFACEPECNRFRADHPLVQHSVESEMQDCGRVVAKAFEPLGGKGAVARATLYFMLRYPGLIGSHYEGRRLETLIAWHEASPPDLWERHRNVAIQGLQGNRNPLIDFPEWVRSIRFAA